MKHIYNLLLITSLIVIISSCSKEDWTLDNNQQSEGRLALSSIAVNVVSEELVVSKTTDYDISQFIVKIFRTGDNALLQSWYYDEMPGVITLPVGEYYVEVLSHEVEDAAWDTPYYYANKSFTIENEKITEVGIITCKLANIKVSIRYSDALKAVLGDDVKVKVIVGERGYLEFSKEVTRSGYFKYVPESNTLVASFSGTVDGFYESFDKTYNDVAAGQHRIITFQLKTGSGIIPDDAGHVDITDGIVVDATIETQDLTVSIPADEEVIDGERPGEGADNGDDSGGDTPATDAISVTSETTDLDGENIVTDGMTAIVNVHSECGIKNFVVDIISEQLNEELLTDVGLASTFDLANPGDLEPGLKSMKFKTGDEVIGEHDLEFNITEFMPLLKIYKGTHKFRLTVTDAEDNTLSKTLTFVVE
ncbi:MAG: DUF4493 domain-containing protein [Muribaculaceae bacterium]|nr:DUF4493 domain-containing protein [Muribaculaceae bacterium]